MKLTREQFVKDVLTFSPDNKYGYRFLMSSNVDNGNHISVANKGDKILIGVYDKNSKDLIHIVFNSKTEEFHRSDETTADKYL